MPLLGYRQNKLYLRCPYCGDSEDETHGHLIVFIEDGAFYCLKCQANGQFSFADQIALYKEHGRPPIRVHKERTKEIDILPGPAEWKRPSLVEKRFNIDGRYDIFQMRTLIDEKVVGYHIRDTIIKQARNEGTRAFGFKKYLPIGSVLRLVEGPYDVVYGADVCIFGMLPSAQQLRQLVYYPLILCPDSDVWNHPKNLKAYFNRFKSHTIQHVERIRDGDPDEVPIDEREIISWETIKNEFLGQKHTLEWLSRLQNDLPAPGHEWVS